MRTALSLLSLTLFFSLATSACRPPDAGARAGDGDVSVVVELPADPVVGPAPITVRLERTGTPLRGATVEVTGDMTHAGMVPVVATAVEQPDGSYRAETFVFDMAGDWVVSVDADLPDGGRARGEAAATVRRP